MLSEITKNVISENVIEKNKKCTYFLYSDMIIEQKMFICGICDFYQLDPMCEECYNSCHKDCYTKSARKSTIHLNQLKPPTGRDLSELELKQQKERELERKIKKKETQKLIREQRRSANKGINKFVCMCGKKNKHQKAKFHNQDDNKEEVKCNLEKDVPLFLLKRTEKYYCQDCDTPICFMCASGCHFFHSILVSPTNKDDYNSPYCCCYNSNHSMNDFLLNLFFSENATKVRFPMLTSPKTKMMNMMFHTKDLFNNLSKFLRKYLASSSSKLMRIKTKLEIKIRGSLGMIQENLIQPVSQDNRNQGNKIESREIELTSIENRENTDEDTDVNYGLKLNDNLRKFLEISGIFFQILYERNDKSYFYNGELRKIFSYENSFLLIDNLCDMEYNSNNTRMILNLVGILFYLHLKADFQRVKNLTISDFMGSKIVTRLHYKRKFFDIKKIISNKEGNIDGGVKSQYDATENKLIEDPYLHLMKYFNERCSMSTISIKLSKIITDCLPALNILVHPMLYEVCLRFINFVLKKMFFTKSELKTLIENLSSFITDFYNIMVHPHNLKELKGNFEVTKYVFYYLIKICYLIAVNYNDIVTQELVEEYKLTRNLSFDEKRKAYIHSNAEYGDKLFKMILKTVMIVAESYSNDLLLDRKVINICNESLKIFSVTENFYMDQINRLKENEILVVGNDVMSSFDKNSNNYFFSEASIISLKLRSKIENIFVEDNTDILNQESKLYLEIDKIFGDLVKLALDLGKNKVPEMTPLNENKTIKESKISEYKMKILGFFADILGFSSKEEFYYLYSGLLFSESFMELLISGNFDEIVSKYFSLFKLKNLDHRDVNSALAIYLLYCFDRKGVEHFCTGKNLSIITKLFASPINAKTLICDEIKIEFLFLLIKGIILNKINLSNDKSLYNITAIIDLILLEREDSNLPDVDEIPYKVKQRIVKIFGMLEASFEFEEFEKIQEKIFLKFRRLLDTKLFKSFISVYENSQVDSFIISKGPSEIKWHNQISVTNVNSNAKNKNEREFSNKLVNGINFDEKTKLIGDDFDSVKPNDNFLRLSENNFYSNSLKKNQNNLKSEELKFYFSFFRFLSINTYHMFYDIPEELESLQEIYNFMDLDYIEIILSKSFLPIKHRICLLVFMRNFYFIDILNSKSKDEKFQHITTEEMYNFNNNKYQTDLPTMNLIKQKAELIFKIIKVMDIFAFELEYFDKLLKIEKFYFLDVQEYLIQIVYSIKIISDFVYYQKKIWDNVNWYLYKIGKRFIQKAKIIKTILLNIKKNNEIGEIIDEDLTVSSQMENVRFNFYDKDLIYNLISDSLIKILKATNVDKNFKLEKYLKEHDRKIQNDFTPTGVITWKGFDELYKKRENSAYDKIKAINEKFGINEEEEEKETEESKIKKVKEHQKKPLRKMLRNIYKAPFVRIYDTVLLRVINTFKTKDDSVDYRRIIINYFLKFFSSDPENKKFFGKISNKIYTEETTVTLLIIVVKLLYYDTKNTQNKFEILNSKYIRPSEDDIPANEENFGINRNSFSSDLCKNFFKSFLNKLQKIFVLNFSTSINFFMFERYTEISELNKLMIQFLQLLAEGFQSSFKPKIFELKLTRTESISIFDIIYTQFKTAYYLMDLHSKIENNNELSHYKLIVLFSNIVDFLIEYIEGMDTANDNKISQMMQNLFDDQIHKCLLTRIDDENYKNKKITNDKIDLCKKLLLRVKSKILELLISFIENGVEENFLKRILKELPMPRIFEEIQFYLYELLESIQNKAVRENGSSFNKNILNVYQEDKRGFCNLLTKLYIEDDENFTDSLELNFCLRLFMFLNILSDVHGIKTIEDHFAQIKINKKMGIKINAVKKVEEVSGLNSETSFISRHAVKVYKFMKNVVKKVDVKNFEEGKIYKTFFFRPPITFYLSNPTQRQFLDNVDRESRFSKLSSLIKQTDYFMFEMVYFSHFNNIGRKINKFLDLYYLEMGNYIFIMVHQIFLLNHFYMSTSLPEELYSISIEDKYKIENDNFILAIIQISYISLILIVWFFFQFPLTLFYNLMTGDSTTFLFKKEGEEKREIIYKFNETSSVKGTIRHFKFVGNVNRHTGFWKKLKVSLLDCLFFNKTISTFAFTFIFIILYLTTGSALFIVFPVLFIINIIPILFGMFVAIKTKWQQLLTMIIFTYLCIYFYMWIGFYFLFPLFEYDDIYVKKV